MSHPPSGAVSALPESPDAVAAARHFGEQLRRLREARHLSQTDVAQHLHRSTSFVSLLESGKRRAAHELIDELATILELSDDEQGQLLRAAGFRLDDLGSAICRIADVISTSLHLDESERQLIEDDLSGTCKGWRDVFQAVAKYREGHFDKAAVQLRGILRHGEYSPALRSMARMQLAEAMLQRGDLKKAEALVQSTGKQLNRFSREAPHALALCAELAGVHGMVALRKGLYPTARALVARSKEIYTKLLRRRSVDQQTARRGLGRYFKRMAQLALFEGEPEEALGFSAMAETAFNRDASATQRVWLRRTRELMGWAYSKLQDHEQAVSYHSAARAESEDAGEVYGVAKNDLYLGDDYRRALELLLKDANAYLTRDSDARRAIIRAIFTDRVTKDEARDWLEKAQAAYHRAVEGFERLGDRILQGRCWRNMAILLRVRAAVETEASAQEELYVEAHRLLQRALILEQEIGQRRRVPSIYESLAELAWDKGSLASARHYYEAALRTLNSTLVSSSDAASARLRERITQALERLPAKYPEPKREEAHGAWPGAARSRDQMRFEWNQHCARLTETLSSYVQAHYVPVTSLRPDDEKWARTLLAWEQESGNRYLAQNALSDALSANGSDASAEVKELHSKRHDVFLHKLRAAASGETTCQDLCSRATIERELDIPETRGPVRTRLRGAAEFMQNYEPAYRLESSFFELPLAIAVKSDHVLVEVPAELAHDFWSHDVESVTDSDVGCYDLRDRALADALIGVFQNLVNLARESVASEPTRDWLTTRIAAMPADSRLRDSRPVTL